MRGLKRNIKILSWHNFCTDFVFFAPVAIIYFTKVTGSVTLGMSIFSVAYVTAALFEVPTGIVSDLVGRRKTLILGSLAAVACVTLYALANDYWWMFMGAVFQGLSRSFYSGNNDALLHDSLKETNQENEYHEYLGKTSSMFQIALALASLAGGIMAEWSFRLVMWASVIPQMAGLILALQITEPKVKSTEESSNIFEHLGEAVRSFRKNYKLKLLTASSVLGFSLGESAFFLRSAFVNSLWPLWAVGLAQMMSNVGGAISFYFSGKVISKFSPLKVLNFEVVYSRIVNLIALLMPTVASPAMMTTTSLTFGVGMVASSSLMQKEFSEKQRATMGSLSSLLGSMFFGIASLGLGLLADNVGVRWALVMANVLLFIPLLLYREIYSHDLRMVESHKTA